VSHGCQNLIEDLSSNDSIDSTKETAGIKGTLKRFLVIVGEGD
jgi:hypothetical protein